MSNRSNSRLKHRRFSMGKDHDIVVSERVTDTDKTDSGTIVKLTGLKHGRSFDHKLSTIAKNLVERLLPYFIAQDYVCPMIVLSESDGCEVIRLNDFVNNEVAPFIKEVRIDEDGFTLMALEEERNFSVRIFRIYAPRNHVSRISLVAHKREVGGSVLHKYVPEFEGEFWEAARATTAERGRNYIVKAYVFSEYLDEHVALERGGFEFGVEDDVIFGIATDGYRKTGIKDRKGRHRPGNQTEAREEDGACSILRGPRGSVA